MNNTNAPKENILEKKELIDNPLISIIMNCYNSDAYLSDTLQSVLSQTYTNWELVFWDNQSTDRSKIIFQGIQDKRLKYFYAPTHTKLGEARNLAVNKANGTWLAFLDCDDLWSEDKLSLQVEKILQVNNFDVGLVYSCFNILVSGTTDPKRVHKLKRGYEAIKCFPHEKKHIYDKLKQSNFVIFSSLLILKKLYLDVGGINLHYVHNEDYDLLLKASINSLAICIESKAVTYRVHNNNNSHKNYEIGYIEILEILKRLPASSTVTKAIMLNSFRYSIYLLSKQKYMAFLKYLSKGFSLSIILHLLATKLRNLFN